MGAKSVWVLLTLSIAVGSATLARVFSMGEQPTEIYCDCFCDGSGGEESENEQTRWTIRWPETVHVYEGDSLVADIDCSSDSVDFP